MPVTPAVFQEEAPGVAARRERADRELDLACSGRAVRQRLDADAPRPVARLRPERQQVAAEIH